VVYKALSISSKLLRALIFTPEELELILWYEYYTNSKDITRNVIRLTIVLPKLFLRRTKSGKHKLLLAYLLTYKLLNRLLKMIKELIIDSKDKMDGDIFGFR
jgi:hypothetical protein